MGDTGAAVTERHDCVSAGAGAPGAAREAVVYCFFDADDTPLYVGSTSRWDVRLDTHRRTSAWYPEVARHEVTACATAREALEQERLLIATAAPRYNVRDGGAGRPPTDPATHKQRHTVTLSPRAWAIVAAYRARHRHRSVSAALEALLRQEES